MFQNAQLDLVKDSGSKSGYSSRTYDSPVNFQFNSAIVSHSTSFRMTNEVKASQVLCTRLSRPSWDLSVDFVLRSTDPQLDGLNLTVQGGLLKELQSLMSYNVEDAPLKLKLKADLMLYREYRGDRVFETKFGYETDLTPSTMNGHYDHSKYQTSPNGPTDCIKAKFDSEGYSWEVSNVHLWVEGVEFDVKKIEESQVKKVKGIFREIGHGPELNILGKSEEGEDGSPISVSENVLIAQSPVIKTMLGEEFVEGSTRQIRMDNWAKEEVMAFLEFLHYGDLEKALANPSLAIILYEMGHYYDVKGLQQAMKIVLLKSPAANSFEVADLLRLFVVARAPEGDNGVKQIVVDVLKLMTEEKIPETDLIRQILQMDQDMAVEILAMFRKF